MFKEIVQNSAGLASFAELGLVIFLVTFTLVVLRALFGMSRAQIDELSHLPLEEERS